MAYFTMSRAALMGAVATIAFETAAFGQTIDKVEWIGADVPATAEQYSDMWTNAKVRVTYVDGTNTESTLGYEMLMSNQSVIGDNFEFDALLANGGNPDDVLGPILPASVILPEVTQGADGKLTPVSQSPVDFSSVGGLAVACNTTMTPWGTFLTSQFSSDVSWIKLGHSSNEELSKLVEGEIKFPDIFEVPEADAFGNKAALDTIANPDNIYWSAAFSTSLSPGLKSPTCCAFVVAQAYPPMFS